MVSLWKLRQACLILWQSEPCKYNNKKHGLSQLSCLVLLLIQHLQESYPQKEEWQSFVGFEWTFATR